MENEIITKRKRSNSNSDKQDLLVDNIYNLPNKLFNINEPIYNKIYDSIKKTLFLKIINIETIIKMDNILDSERLILVEKYSIMNNSHHDLQIYIKNRDELLDLINYYTTTDINQRKINIEKKIKLNKMINNIYDIEDKILNIDNIDIQQIIYSKYKKLQNMSPIDSEYNKLKESIDIYVNIPFKNIYRQPVNNISKYLLDIKNKLDLELYGMNHVKEELLMAINQRLINLSKSTTNIALVGPPGVGKTKLISVLANILGYEFEHISLGGVNDSSYLAGHSYTYEGAKPGKIVESLIKMKTNDGLLFFDEIDKISSINGKEVSNQLLHITDFTQNNHFTDRYLSDIPIDLSKIWFIFSLNSITDIDPILSNRLNYIYINDYTIDDKINICKLHIIPNAFNKYKIDNQKYIFDDNTIIRIINFNNNISGIRELQRSIDKIFNRLSLLENSSQLLMNNLSFNISFKKSQNIISNEIIDKFLL